MDSRYFNKENLIHVDSVGGVMAYFANGTEGMTLDYQCCNCLLDGEGLPAYCPVYYVQAEYNYQQCNKGKEHLKKLLNYLVNEKGECQMKKAIDEYGKIQRPAPKTWTRSRYDVDSPEK